MANELIQQVQQALGRLGDPTYLEVHPLTAMVPTDTPGESGGARLRNWLIASIEGLKPGDGAEGGAHRLMEQRYVAGRSVVRVCHDLGLSESEYYRQHRRALAAVAAVVGSAGPAAAEAPARPPLPDPLPSGAGPVPAPTNLPHRPTSFVGREGEIAEVRGLLGEAAVLTIVGAPGIGKTRLALEIGSRALPDYPDGVWLVELAGLTEPALVPQSLALVLGVRQSASQPLEEALAAHLRPRRLLLILDNCEHLVDACAGLLDALLGACPDVRVLATSREALRVDGEVAYRLAPLPLPPADVVTPEQLDRSAAVQLFVGRARAVDPAFTTTPAEAEAVARICRRLDGIALAIELAAARVGVLSIAEIEARLDDRFRLLAAGRRTALPRQQTLAALFDFSYELLTEAERALLRRLSVFSGTFDLAAAEDLCADVGEAGDAVADLLARLVDKSLVLFDRPGGRYRLLETIRMYAGAKLREAGEDAALMQRQSARLLALLAEAEPYWPVGGELRRRWADRIEQELDDVRAARRWCLANDPESALRLAVGLWRFWWGDPYKREGLRWLLEALAAAEAGSPARARGLMAAGFLARFLRDFDRALQLTDAAMPLLEAAGDDASAGLALHNLGMIALARGEASAATAHFTRSVVLSRAAGDRPSVGMTLRDLGHLAAERGDPGAAEVYLRESLSELSAVGDHAGAAETLAFLGEVAAARGDFASAAALLEEGQSAGQRGGTPWAVAYNRLLLGRSRLLAGDTPAARVHAQAALALFREIDARQEVARALGDLGDVARAEGDAAEARSRYEQSVAIAREVNAVHEAALALASAAELARRGGELPAATRLARDAVAGVHAAPRPVVLAQCVAVAARVALAAGETALGARLAGWASATDPLLAGRMPPDERRAHDAALSAARGAIGEAAFAAAAAEGAALTRDEAIELAGGVRGRPAEGGASAAPIAVADQE